MVNSEGVNNGGESKVYDLEERTAVFGENVILWCRKLSRDSVTQRLIPQCIGAATAVGANYCEADCAESNQDFIHKCAIVNKEAKESRHFVRMLLKACPEHEAEGRPLLKEAHELNLIFTTIVKKAKETERKKKAGV